MSAPPKLTAKQQDVVNLMGAGYVLSASFGTGRHGGSASLWKGSDRRAISCNVPFVLEKKGVASVAKRDWRGCGYSLTAIGKTLVQKTVNLPAQVWWTFCDWNCELESRSFASSTDQFLIDSSGRKSPKSSKWHHWYPTREMAVKALRCRLENSVSRAESELRQAQSARDKFNRKEPAQ